jgi:hypothetical protein
MVAGYGQGRNTSRLELEKPAGHNRPFDIAWGSLIEEVAGDEEGIRRPFKRPLAACQKPVAQVPAPSGQGTHTHASIVAPEVVV